MLYLKLRETALRLTTGYWFFPIVMLVLGVVLASIMLGIDSSLPNTEGWLLFKGSASEAQTALLSLAGTILGTASVVYSLLTVPLSVAAGQFGSRLLRIYMLDRTTQSILGLFVGTFIYLLTVALGIPSAAVRADASLDAPQLSVSLGLLLSLITFGSIIVLVHHIGTSLQAPSIAAAAGEDLLRTLEYYDQHYRFQSEIPHIQKENPTPEMVAQKGHPIYASRKGYIQHIDLGTVISLAERFNLTISVNREAGDFIQPGDLIAYAFPPANMTGELAARISAAYKLGNQRTPTQDLVYAVHQLVEVAVRAMSPAINDPFTAITCLHHIGAGLSAYADHEFFQYSHHLDTNGNLRLIFDPVTFPELLGASFNMIRSASRDNADVLLTMLNSIERIVYRSIRAETRMELRCHVNLVEAECLAGKAINWDRERVIQKCAEVQSILQSLSAVTAKVKAGDNSGVPA